MFYEVKERPMGATGGIPIFNELNIPSGPDLFARRKYNVRLLVEWIQKTPEAVSLLRKISNDIVTRVTFKAVSSKKSGRPKKSESSDKEEIAAEFFMNNQGKQQLQASVMDWLMTGDSYIWIGKATDDMMKESKSLKWLNNKYNQAGVKESVYKIRHIFDEDYGDVTNFRYAPSETVEIDHDETTIKGYKQETYASFNRNWNNQNYINSGIRKRYWTPDQIIHAKFMELSGKVYGYTPMYANSAVIRTLGLIKDYAGTFFQNGGVPDWLFMFESQGFTNKQNIDYLKAQLQKYKSSATKHGNLIGESSGKFQAHKLNDFHKDMEFRQLMIMYAGLIAWSFDYPSARMKSIIGSDIKGSTGETDAETDAYERSTINSQDYFEGLWNTQLWIPHFGVKMELFNNYLQDEVRETQVFTQNVAGIKQMVDLGITPQKEYVMTRLHLKEDDIDKFDLVSAMDFKQNAPMPNSKVLKGAASQAFQHEKREQAPKDKNKQMGN